MSRLRAALALSVTWSFAVADQGSAARLRECERRQLFDWPALPQVHALGIDLVGLGVLVQGSEDPGSLLECFGQPFAPFGLS